MNIPFNALEPLAKTGVRILVPYLGGEELPAYLVRYLRADAWPLVRFESSGGDTFAIVDITSTAVVLERKNQ